MSGRRGGRLGPPSRLSSSKPTLKYQRSAGDLPELGGPLTAPIHSEPFGGGAGGDARVQHEMAKPDATVFTAAQRVRSFEDIIAQVRDAVAEGRLRPGERLPSERALAESFGVSRATLREALRSLEALGVVEIRLGATGGAFASEPD